LKTRLKTMFNAGFSDLVDVRLLGSSEGELRAAGGGQSFLDGPEMIKVRVSGARRRTARASSR